jgi:hypothetical protein
MTRRKEPCYVKGFGSWLPWLIMSRFRGSACSKALKYFPKVEENEKDIGGMLEGSEALRGLSQLRRRLLRAPHSSHGFCRCGARPQFGQQHTLQTSKL